VVIPTFWARRRGRFTDRLINVYDHPTPVDEDGTLPACLDSLRKVDGLERVIVIVAAADASVEHEAEDRVRSILAARPWIDAMVPRNSEACTGASSSSSSPTWCPA
jgi:hypothetical protein